MDHFKQFIETLGVDSPLAKDADTMPFYALPYISMYEVFSCHVCGDCGDLIAHTFYFYFVFVIFHSLSPPQTISSFLPFFLSSFLPFFPFLFLTFLFLPSTTGQPHKHPSFQAQFTPAWTTTLREQLERVLFVVLQVFSSPKLHKLLSLQQKDNTLHTPRGSRRRKRSQERKKKESGTTTSRGAENGIRKSKSHIDLLEEKVGRVEAQNQKTVEIMQELFKLSADMFDRLDKNRRQNRQVR